MFAHSPTPILAPAARWHWAAMLRHAAGLSASPPVRYILKVAGIDKPLPATSYLLKADRVFDARSEHTHSGWAVAATAVDAKILRQQDDFGQLRQGLDADIIALPRDPTQDISAIEHVRS
jgi:hypothetical protein